MCCSYGSLDQATAVCPMCKVFKPSARCPHVRDVCRNRQNHPRFDVLYLKNAEVQCFNGCGYCKWANANPTSGYVNNTGWPGCCRPPAGVQEYRMIQPADWHAVTAVHHVPIPHEIKVALDLIAQRSSMNARDTSIRRSSTPPVDRNRSNSSASKSSPTIPQKTFIAPSNRSRQVPQTLSPTSKRDDGHSSPNSGKGSSDPEKRRAGTRLSLDNRVSPITPQKLANETARRSPLTSPPVAKPIPSANRLVPIVTSKAIKKPIPMAPSSSGSSSSGSESDSLGSQTDGTVTSDGGFTDYLSEESEAELQRQAEAKAAVVAQNEMEELEFKAARMKLAQVDLRPPKSWSASNNNGPPRISGNAPRYTANPAVAAGTTRG